MACKTYRIRLPEIASPSGPLLTGAATGAATGGVHCSARRGSALAMALIVVTLVAMLGAGYVSLSSSLTRRQSAAVQQQQAFYMAEAGLAEAFQAVRMSRTGQIGTVTAPARFGLGLLWVDAIEEEDRRVRLESTALCGSASRTLSLVVEPVELALGFFSDEDLVVDAVVLVDGWSSEESSYDAAVVDPGPAPPVESAWSELKDYTDWLFSTVSDDKTLGKLIERSRGDITDPLQVAKLVELSPEQQGDLLARLPDLRTGYPSGYDPAGPVHEYGGGPPPESVPESPTGPSSETPTGDGGYSLLGPTTGDGGLLASNGDISFALPPGPMTEIWGDVQPGFGGEAFGLESVSVSGDTTPRTLPVELPEVEVPPVALAAPVLHDDLLPMLVPSGISGHERIEVASGAELVLRGPATVVIGELVLRDGASLSLDTRFGDVALYITGSIDLQPGSLVSNSGEEPAESTLQVAAAPSGSGDPTVKLDATARFHGTVYAPDADVRVGSDFEVCGGIVARRLDLEPGARLHFDRSGFAGSALPRIVGWRVSEVPTAVRYLGGDPFGALGLDRGALPALSDAHDLAAVDLAIVYIDKSGSRRTFEGTEDKFNWKKVVEVVSIERVPHRTQSKAKDQPGDASLDPLPEEEPPKDPLAVRQEVIDVLESKTGSALLLALEAQMPLSDMELITMLQSDVMRSGGGETANYGHDILRSSTPASEAVLLEMLQPASNLFSSDIKDVLLASCPLPASVEAMVADAPADVLSLSDKTAVLRAR